jgi:hypothetical protein
MKDTNRDVSIGVKMMDLLDIKSRIFKDEKGNNIYMYVSVEEMDWLVEQAEIVGKIKDFCEQESNTYGELKMDETRHKVDSIFFNGKQRAFGDVRRYIENLEES